MPKLLDILKENAAYAFAVVGVIWLVVAVFAGTPLLVWPVVACFASTGLLKLRPADRLTWAWATSSSVMGLLISGYQAYFWAPLVGGSLSSVASLSMAGFLVFAVVHLLLAYVGGFRPGAAKLAGQS
jgi:hypothetical protein